MGAVPGQPRDFVDPSEPPGAFGRATTVRWVAPTASNRAPRSAAFRQHAFAGAVVTAMKAEGLTRGQLAAEIGSGEETLRRKLRGEKWITWQDVSVIALALPQMPWPIEPDAGPEPD
jgi:hypothetical protein